MKYLNHIFSQDNRPTEKNFGIVFSVFFLIVAGLFFFQSKEIYKLFIILFLFFISASLIIPKIFIIPNMIWHSVGNLLGLIVSPIIMAIIFFLIITPIAIFIKILKVDIINQKIDLNKHSYWILKKNDGGSMKDQF